ncbi:MAG: tetratricopeptide repeat protein [Candidatus Eiseniibacteriota bacterium]
MSDPGAEFVDQVSALWRRYDRMVLGALGALVVIAAGGYYALRTRSTQEDQAAGMLAEAQVMFWQGDYTQAIDRAKRVFDQFPATRSGHDAHRLMGDSQYWSGNFKAAIAEYQKYLALQKTGVLASAARRSLAYAYESSGQYADAAPIYLSLVGIFDRESSAEFLLAAARCDQQLKKDGEATKSLQRLLDEFGDTPQAQEARVLMGELAKG